MNSEISAMIEKLRAENEELKMKNSDLEEASQRKAPSYYDYFFSPKKSYETPREIPRRSSDSDLLTSSMVTPTPRKLQLNEESLSSRSNEYQTLESKENSSVDSNESEIKSDLKVSSRKSSSSNKLLDHNIAMGKIITKATEKDDIPKIKMKGLENEHLHKFLSDYSPDSELSAVYQLPKVYRKGMEVTLKIPRGTSLVNFYKDSVGPNQTFIRDITKVLTKAYDFNLVTVIRSHDISKITSYDSSKVYSMLHECDQEISIFKSVIEQHNSLEIKQAILENVGPKAFHDYIVKDYGFRISSDYFSITDTIDIIMKSIEKYSAYQREHSKHGYQSKQTVSTVTTDLEEKKKKDEKDAKKAKEDKKKEDDKSFKKSFKKQCWNCLVENPDHKISGCTEPCRVHNSKDCVDTYKCLEDDKTKKTLENAKKKENVSLCTNPSGTPCSCIIDTGASATATHSKDLLNKNSIELDKKLNGVEIGDGSTIDIAGKGKVADTEVFFIPELNKTVIAADVVQSSGRVTILRNNKLTTYKHDVELLSKLNELEKMSVEKELLVVDVTKENGIYPITDKQAKRLCTDDTYTEPGVIYNLFLPDDDTKICDDEPVISSSIVAYVSPLKSSIVNGHKKKSVSFAKNMVTVIEYRDDLGSTLLYSKDYDSSSTKYPYKIRGEGSSGRKNIEINSSSYFGVENSKLRDEVLLWHINLDHASKKSLISNVENNIYENIPKNLTTENINKHLPPCPSCPFGNMRAKPLPTASSSTYAPGECAVGDIKHMEEPDIYGNEYLALFVDLGSDKVFEYAIKRMNNLVDVVRSLNNTYMSYGHTMKTIRFDVQFLTKEVTNYLNNASPNFEKIDQEHPAPYEHGQNGKAENTIQKIENSIQKVLKDSSAPKSYWGPIASHVCKIRNTMNTKKNPSVSRNVAFGGKKTDLSATVIFPFGAKALAHINPKHQTSLSFKCFEAVYMGPADGVKGGILLRSMKTNRNIIRRTFKILGPGDSEAFDSKFDINIEIEEEEDGIPDLQLSSDSEESSHLDREYLTLNRNSTEVNNQNKKYFNYVKSMFDDDFDKTSYKITAIVKENKSKGAGSKTLYFKYYDVIRFPGGPNKEIDFDYTPCSELLKDKHIVFDSIDNRDSVKINTIVSMRYATRIYRVDFKTEAQEPPPKSRNEAIAHPETGYFDSYLDELHSFHIHKADVPADMDIKDIDPDLILQLIPLFQKKFSGANFEKFKCRMILLGNKWKNTHGTSTYASMIGVDTLKLLLAIGASLDMEMCKFDIKTAFLKTKVDPKNKYYVRRPPGATNEEMPYISEPECYIYGHPLANAEWDDRLSKKLIQVGGKATKYDENIYIIDNEHGRAIISTIVDDMPTLYSGGQPMKDFLASSLNDFFETTCDDPLTTVFGMEVTRYRKDRTVKLQQRGSQKNLFDKYIPTWETDKISSFAKIPCNPNGPMSQENLALEKIILTSKEKQIFQSIVGELNWITITGPDFIYAIKKSARRTGDPNQYDMKCAMQTVSCMAGIVRQDKDGLIIGGQTIDLLLTTDTSYHGFDDLKSCTGGTVHLNPMTGSIISMSEKHKVTTDSAMAAEGVGSHLHIKKILPILYLFEELGLKMEHPASFYMDNIPFMQTITGNKGLSGKSKHILIRLQMTKEAFQDGKIELKHLRTDNMVADILTKALAYDKWNNLRDPLLGRSPVILNDESDNLLVVSSLLIF